MNFFAKYKLFLITVGTVMCCLYFMVLGTNIQYIGYMDFRHEATAFQVGYYGELSGNNDLRESIKQHNKYAFMVAPEHLYGNKQGVPPASFYPVFDGSLDQKQFGEKYTYLPGETLPSYGKTVYFTDFADTRFVFLNGQAIAAGDLEQMKWLEQTVETNKKPMNVAFINQDPKIPAFWETMMQVGIHLVIIGNDVYSANWALEQSPANYRPTPNKGWGQWAPYRLAGKSHLLVLEGTGKLLNVLAVGKSGEALDQMVQNPSRGKLTGLEKELSLIAIHSVWRYRAGGVDLPIRVPEGYDITGLTPMTKRMQVPSGDWRHPVFNDADWQLGKSAFVHSDSSDLSRNAGTQLPFLSESSAYYFRKTFTLDENLQNLKYLLMHISFEDGFTAYINGEEIDRKFIDTGQLTPWSLALPSEPVHYRTVDISTHLDKLVKGTNTIAVEVHRSHPNARGMLFDLSLTYERK